jgi:hypothetical protein
MLTRINRFRPGKLQVNTFKVYIILAGMASSTSSTPELAAWLDKYRISNSGIETEFDRLGVEQPDDIALLCTEEDLEALQISLKPLPFKKFLKAAMDTFDDPDVLAALQRVEIAPTVLLQKEERLQMQLDNLRGNGARTNSAFGSVGSIGIAGSTTRRLQQKIESHERAIAAEKTKQHSALRQTVDRLHRVRRVKDIEGLDALLSRAAEVDLAFVVDLTGSMTGHWHAIQTQMSHLVDEIAKCYPEVPLRVGFAGYREHGDSDRLPVQPLTSVVTEFERAAKSRSTAGGRGNCADVHGGLNAAAHFEWKSTTRVLVHFGDEPCHGTQFHNYGQGDGHWAGDPTGLVMEDIISLLRENNVTYFFGRITSRTDKMIEVIEKMGIKVTTIDATQAQSIMTSVASAVASSMTSSVSSSARLRGPKIIPRNLRVVKGQASPDWSSITSLTAEQYTLSIPASMNELEHRCWSGDVYKLSAPQLADIKMLDEPFDEGAVRFAFRGWQNGIEVVFKSFRSSVKEDHDAAACALSPHFNSLNICRTIELLLDFELTAKNHYDLCII